MPGSGVVGGAFVGSTFAEGEGGVLAAGFFCSPGSGVVGAIAAGLCSPFAGGATLGASITGSAVTFCCAVALGGGTEIDLGSATF